MNSNVGNAPASVLIVGCGNIAGGFDMSRPGDSLPLTHAGAFHQHPDFRVTACVEPDDAKRQAFAQHWRIPKDVASIEELRVDSDRFDVISICSPTHLHHAHLGAALALQPRVIFCEKPLTSTERESERWVKACRKQGVTLTVNYTRHWDPAIDRLITDLRSGRWGRIRSLVGYYNKGILNNGGHLIELVLRLAGPLDLVATLGCEHDHWPDDPTVAALLRTREHGVPVYLSPSDARDYAIFELELICEKGVIRMFGGGLGWQFREVTMSEEYEGYKVLTGFMNSEGSCLQAMTRAVSTIHRYLKEGVSVMSTGEDALEVQRICNAILDAANASAGSPSPKLVEKT